MLVTSLALASVGTTLLLARFLVLSARERPAHKDRCCPRPLSVFWVMGLTGAAAAVGLVFPGPALTMLSNPSLVVNFWNDLWPAPSGALIAWAACRSSARWAWRHHFSIPPGGNAGAHGTARCTVVEPPQDMGYEVAD